MIILSIDIGTRNFGYAVWDSDTETITDFGVLDLDNYYKGTDYARKIYALQEEGFFKKADIILVEIQMKASMKILANSIRCLNWQKTIRIAPQCVKRHFKTFTKKHSTNKKAHLTLLQHLHPGLCTSNKYTKLHKKDDVADAIIQLEYFISCKLNSIYKDR